ncbi:WXG100 family type VII secretion target [Micromonospora krabiensis]|uniref:WXG100 family type VII secretion target n=1 Tax=Micromonospora krabiensis TaxID=307121 RepID=A0A1C3N775_9ACTN|nr:hypothetical protein [Micromonospora krabiensis]SBV28393.1 hypothetical protein GA0070620_3936 [Micromonospora krabiensis]
MGDKSWEQMAREVLVAGRPDHIASAALGWKELVKNIGEVKESLEKNVKDLGAVWKGPAYEAFKTHVEGLAKQAGNLQDDINSPGRGRVGIVTTLETAARNLETAQNAMPIPAACVGDVLAARNGEITLGVGMFEAKVKADLLGSWPAEQVGKLTDWVTGWFSDQEGEARKVYDQVNADYRDRVMETPTTRPDSADTYDSDVPNLDTGDRGKGIGSVPDIGGNAKTGGIGDVSTAKLDGMPETGKPGIGSGAHPELSNDYPDTTTGGGYPGTGGIPDDYGTGLAGAGGGTATAPGLGSGFGSGGTGLGASGGGLGGGGGLSGGAGAGMIPGGGALGRAVSPGMPPMMGGGAAGAGRGGGGRLGGGKLGAGGMPGMGGMAGGGAAGKGGGGKAGAAGLRGAGARGAGIAGMGGAGGAGYGEEESARNTWLEEDEDVWGADGDGAPGILR